MSDRRDDMSASAESISLDVSYSSASRNNLGTEGSVASDLVEAYDGVKARNTGHNSPQSKEDDESPSMQYVEAVDHALISVPYSSSQRYLREVERLIEKELLLVTSYLSKRIITLTNKDEVLDKLNRALERLCQIVATLKQLDEQLCSNISQLKDRLSILDVNRVPTIKDTAEDFKFSNYRKRISWVISEYLSRKGCFASAKALYDVEHLNSCIDIPLHESCINVFNDLYKCKVDKAVEWADNHREALDAVGSHFWRDVKIQEVVVRLQTGDVTKATELLRNLKGDVFKNSDDARRLYSAMVFLSIDLDNGEEAIPAFSVHRQRPGDMWEVTTKSPHKDGVSPRKYEIPFKCIFCMNDPKEDCSVCDRYIELISDDRWDYLCFEFEKCVSLVYGVGKKPILEKLIEQGFCAIKSDSCNDHRTPTCPACLPEWKEYVNQIPSSHKLNSILLCPVTGSVMTYENPPFATPGGYVLSERGIRTMSQTDHTEKKVRCPKTKEVIDPDDFRRIFIA